MKAKFYRTNVKSQDFIYNNYYYYDDDDDDVIIKCRFLGLCLATFRMGLCFTNNLS